MNVLYALYLFSTVHQIWSVNTFPFSDTGEISETTWWRLHKTKDWNSVQLSDTCSERIYRGTGPWKLVANTYLFTKLKQHLRGTHQFSIGWCGHWCCCEMVWGPEWIFSRWWHSWRNYGTPMLHFGRFMLKYPRSWCTCDHSFIGSLITCHPALVAKNITDVCFDKYVPSSGMKSFTTKWLCIRNSTICWLRETMLILSYQWY